MKARIIYISVGIFLLSGLSLKAQIQNPNVYNPARAARRNPVTSYQPGLIPNRPEAAGGNDVITGNVASGRQFRGSLPYRSSTSFFGPLSSTQLDSFRRLSIPPDYTLPPGRYQPFYSRSGSVTSTTLGGKVFKPGIDYLPGQRPAEIEEPQGEDIYVQSARRRTQEQLRARQQRLDPLDITTLIPVSPDRLTSDKSLLLEAKEFETYNDLTPAQRRAKIEQIIEDLGLETQKPEPETDGVESTEPFIRDDAKTQTQAFQRQDSKQRLEPFTKERPTPDEYKKPEQKPDSRDKLEQLTPEILQPQEFDQVQPDSETEQPTPDSSDELMQKFEEMKKSAREKTAPKKLEKGITKDVMEEMPTGHELEAYAKNILGKHKDFDSYAKDRYNTHLLYGTEMLKKGQYYQASEAFTMALVYQPESWLAMAGKGHSLFAAGEYMTSAMYISNALEIYPAFAGANLTVEDMVGDRDTLDARLAEIDQLQEKVDVTELHFLESYFYYRTNRLDEAKNSINQVLGDNPDVKGAKVLQNAIQKASAGR